MLSLKTGGVIVREGNWMKYQQKTYVGMIMGL